ncbi:uncharacterized protein LOC144109887 [Amblyomma americanum]
MGRCEDRLPDAGPKTSSCRAAALPVPCAVASVGRDLLQPTFSFSGYDAVRLASIVRRINLLRADFCVVYVGGNDISRPNTSPQEICDNIKALVLQLLRDVAPVVLVVKVLPRWFITADAEVSRSWLNRRHLLNRKLTVTLKRMPSVFILNPDHRFLDARKLSKRHLFGADGYHLSAGEGVEELAEILVRSLEKVYGPCSFLKGANQAHH